MNAPIRHIRGHSIPPRPQLEPALVFEQGHLHNRHSQMWLGNRSFAPDWAKTYTSAREVSKMKINHLPSIHKIRNVQNAQYRSVPLDGVNQIQDVIIKKKIYVPH